MLAGLWGFHGEINWFKNGPQANCKVYVKRLISDDCGPFGGINVLVQIIIWKSGSTK